MQNKANLLDALMNVTSLITVDYKNIANCKLGENKPNSNPIRTQSNPIKANKMPKQTQYKPNQTQSHRSKVAQICVPPPSDLIEIWEGDLFRELMVVWLVLSGRNRKHRAASGYSMFSGGEKNSYFCISVIGNGPNATLTEKLRFLPNRFTLSVHESSVIGHKIRAEKMNLAGCGKVRS